jgi:hypothetical protein
VLLSVAPPRPAPPAAFLYRLLRQSVDIRAIWSVGHCAAYGAANHPATSTELLAFADHATLASLRKCSELHRSDVELLVVVDGDAFESAWGERQVSGSLSRWAWHEVSPEHAFYDEARWASHPGESGGVVRERREAYLIWRLAERMALS